MTHIKLRLALPFCSCNFRCHWLKITLALLLSMNFLQLLHKFIPTKIQNKSRFCPSSDLLSLCQHFTLNVNRNSSLAKTGANKMNWIPLIILIDAFSTQLTRASGSRFSRAHVKTSSWQSHPPRLILSYQDFTDPTHPSGVPLKPHLLPPATEIAYCEWLSWHGFLFILMCIQGKNGRRYWRASKTQVAKLVWSPLSPQLSNWVKRPSNFWAPQIRMRLWTMSTRFSATQPEQKKGEKKAAHQKQQEDQTHSTFLTHQQPVQLKHWKPLLEHYDWSWTLKTPGKMLLCIYKERKALWSICWMQLQNNAINNPAHFRVTVWSSVPAWEKIISAKQQKSPAEACR